MEDTSFSLNDFVSVVVLVLVHWSLNLPIPVHLPFPIHLTYIVLLQWLVSHLTIYLVRVYMTGETKASINQPMMLEATHHLCQDLIYIHPTVSNRLCMVLALFMDKPMMEVIILAVVYLQNFFFYQSSYLR